VNGRGRGVLYQTATWAATRAVLWAATGVAGLFALAAGAGCSSRPNASNIVLRKENQGLTEQVADLQRHNAGLEAQLTAAQAGKTTPQLPEARLEKLFTVHGLQFGRLTGGYSPDPSRPDEMLKVYVVPTDETGQGIKAAGTFKVELFDLAEPDTHLGEWDFSVEQARADWYDQSFIYTLYTYVLSCPWQTPPRHDKLTMRVTFTDELTGRVFTVDRDVTVKTE
jgi:hypothetical protein